MLVELRVAPRFKPEVWALRVLLGLDITLSPPGPPELRVLLVLLVTRDLPEKGELLRVVLDLLVQLVQRVLRELLESLDLLVRQGLKEPQVSTVLLE